MKRQMQILVSPGAAVVALVLAAACAAAADTRIDGRPGQPAIADGVAFVGSSSGRLHAIDLGSGERLWQAIADGPVFHAPAVTDELVLFGSQDGRLRAVERATGELRWSFAAGDVDREVRDIFINGTPSIVDGIAYFSSEDWNVYAVDVETGREAWRHTLGEEPQAWHIPIVDRVAYIGAWDGHLYALAIDTGERAWVSQTDDTNRADLPEQVPFVTAVPIVDDESVYFTDWAGNLFAVDRATGKQRWRYDAVAIDGRHVGSRSFIAMHEDVIYFSTVEDRHLVGVDRHSGREVWRTRTEGIAYGPGELAEGIAMYLEVLPGDGDGPPAMAMRVLDLGTRRVLWSADDVGGPPAASGATVYYVSTGGFLRARGIVDGRPVDNSIPVARLADMLLSPGKTFDDTAGHAIVRAVAKRLPDIPGAGTISWIRGTIHGMPFLDAVDRTPRQRDSGKCRSKRCGIARLLRVLAGRPVFVR